jgi:hypothetical protein
MREKNEMKQSILGSQNGPDLQKTSGSSPPTLEQVEQRILAFLFTRAMPAKEKDIQRGVRVRKALLVKALRNLHRKRRIRRLGVGLNKCEFWYFICGSCLQRFGKSNKLKGDRS